MRPYLACLKAYFAPWWMKLIALIAVCVIVIGMVVCFKAKPNWEPAWYKPTLVGWHQVNGLQVDNGDGQLQTNAGDIDPKNVVGLTIDRRFSPRIDPQLFPNLKYVRLDLPIDQYLNWGAKASEEYVEQARTASATELIKTLVGTSIDTIELSGRVDPIVLEPLAGHPTIRRVITSELHLTGVNRERSDVEQMRGLVRMVASFPNLEVWGPPIADMNRLRQVPNNELEAVVSGEHFEGLISLSDENVNPVVLRVRRTLSELFPQTPLLQGYIDKTRFIATFCVMAAAIALSNIVIFLMAELLFVSSAPVLPNYCQRHRATVLATVLTVSLLAFVCQIGVGVALWAAVGLALWAAAIPAVMIERDMHRPVPGALIMPLCFAPFFAVYSPSTLKNWGWFWLGFERFLQGHASTFYVVGTIVVAAYLLFLFWRAVPVYASNLASAGRSAIIHVGQSDVGNQWGRIAEHNREKSWMRHWKGIARYQGVTDPAINEGTLASPATDEGLQKLIRQGMVGMPIGNVIAGVVVFCVLFPLFLRSFVADGVGDWKFSAGMMALMLGMSIWMRPIIGWTERALRVPSDIGSLVPRARYVAAVRAILTKQFLLPTVLTAIVGAGFLIWKDSPLATLLGIPVLAVVIHMIAVSSTEFSLTLQSGLAKMLLILGTAYVGLGSAIGAYGVLVNVSKIDADFASITLAALPGTLALCMAVGMRYFATRRMRNFEFGRLV